MNKIFFLSTIFLSAISFSQTMRGNFFKAEVAAVGACHLTISQNGATVSSEDISLSSIEPWTHFGLVLTGSTGSFQIEVLLSVSNYDQIGALPSDRVQMIITQGSVASHYSISGSAFSSGEDLKGILQLSDKSVNCTIQRTRSVATVWPHKS